MWGAPGAQSWFVACRRTHSNNDVGQTPSSLLGLCARACVQMQTCEVYHYHQPLLSLPSVFLKETLVASVWDINLISHRYNWIPPVSFLQNRNPRQLQVHESRQFMTNNAIKHTCVAFPFEIRIFTAELMCMFSPCQTGAVLDKHYIPFTAAAVTQSVTPVIELQENIIKVRPRHLLIPIGPTMGGQMEWDLIYCCATTWKHMETVHLPVSTCTHAHNCM